MARFGYNLISEENSKPVAYSPVWAANSTGSRLAPGG